MREIVIWTLFLFGAVMLLAFWGSMVSGKLNPPEPPTTPDTLPDVQVRTVTPFTYEPYEDYQSDDPYIISLVDRRARYEAQRAACEADTLAITRKHMEPVLLYISGNTKGHRVA